MRAVAVWHRRAGKDSSALNWTAVAAHQRTGVYWHMLPTQAQGRKVVWDAIDAQGRRVVDTVFPRSIRAGTNKQEMKIELACGSIWQVVGSDNFNSLVGANPIGVVMSEYSLADPAAWDFIRPILAENGGWAIFIFTPRGRNHGHRLLQMAEKTPGWFAQTLTVDDTRRPDTKNGVTTMVPVISARAIAEDRASGMAEEIVQQEYYCSFDASLVGSYYGKYIEDLRRNGRIMRVPYDESLPVDTWWDLGIGDSTAIWFSQRAGDETRLIDFHRNSGQGLPYYVKILQERGYVYGTHVAPHDIEVRELTSGKTRKEIARSLGVDFVVAPKVSIEDGIQSVRALLPKCIFDADKCVEGIDALSMYRKEWDEDKRTFKDKPLHDWTSDPADAFRYGAVTRPRGKGFARNTVVPDHAFNVF